MVAGGGVSRVGFLAETRRREESEVGMCVPMIVRHGVPDLLLGKPGIGRRLVAAPVRQFEPVGATVSVKNSSDPF